MMKKAEMMGEKLQGSKAYRVFADETSSTTTF